MQSMRLNLYALVQRFSTFLNPRTQLEHFQVPLEKTTMFLAHQKCILFYIMEFYFIRNFKIMI